MSNVYCISAISALLLFCVPAIVAGAEDTVAASSDSLTIAFEDISSITSSHPASTNLRGNEPTSKVQDVLVFFREYSYDDGEAEDYIELSLPIPVNVRSRSLKKEKKDKDKDKKGGGGGGSDKDKYDEIIAKYKAQQQKGASSTGTQQAQQTLQQQQGQQQYHNQPSAGTVISSGGGVLHISGGTIDLRGVRGTPSTTPAKRTCVEVPPIMGCDGGGADNQKMKFLNVDFGTCSNCDRGLFKVMPTKMVCSMSSH